MTAVMLIRELDRLYLAAQQSGDPADWDAYTVMKATVDRMLRSCRTTVEIDRGRAEPPDPPQDTAPAPFAPRNGLISRLRAFLRAVAIRFRSRVGLPLAGSGS